MKMSQQDLFDFIESAKSTRSKAIAIGLTRDTIREMTETIDMLKTQLAKLEKLQGE